MARNKLSDLRDHLFAALEGLSDQDHPLDLDRAKAISEVSQTIINTAKVEIEMVKTLNACSASSFFETLEHKPNRLLEEAHRPHLEAYGKKETP